MVMERQATATTPEPIDTVLIQVSFKEFLSAYHSNDWFKVSTSKLIYTFSGISIRLCVL